MKTRTAFISMLLTFMMALFIINSCSKDEPVPLKLVSLAAGSIDLNGATSPNNVPVDPVITATFNTNVDPATATSSTITLVQNYDGANIELNISVDGKTVTISPKSELGHGALYQLTITEGLKSKDGEPLVSLTRSFTTEGTFVPSGQVAHWGFENNANDDVGTWNAKSDGVVDISYVNSRNAAAGKAASFNGTTSIIEIPNGDQLINTHDFTISFWVKTNSADKTSGHFVLGLGAFYGIQFEIFGGYDGAKFAIRYELGDGSTASEDMWFPSNATDNTNGGWQGWDFAKPIPTDQMVTMLKDNWLHVVYTYNSAERKGTLYYNGEKMKSFDFDLWPDNDPKRTVVGLKYGGVAPEVVNELAFGFIQSRAGTLWDNESWGGYDFPGANHFKGLLDDVRIFHKALTATEINLMYNSEKP
ncbi:MAG: hypothetical protein GYA22_02005 [Bacteroidales bacterium]|nr:hypothetical protein [Bacteroidales bacterium]